MSSTFTILLKNCAFFARHGVHAEENVLGQRFFVDAELEVESGALGADDIRTTVDYASAFKVIEETVTLTQRRLIETLANDIATALFARFKRIQRASITVRKPGAAVPGILDYVQVSIERTS